MPCKRTLLLHFRKLHIKIECCGQASEAFHVRTQILYTVLMKLETAKVKNAQVAIRLNPVFQIQFPSFYSLTGTMEIR